MGRSLYDLLEVSEIASQEVIHAAYARLSDSLKSKIANSDAPDAEIQLRAIHDAYRMLSNTQSRQRYDESLAMKNVVYEDDGPFWTKTKTVLTAIIFLAVLGVHAKHSRDVEKEQTERLRIAAVQAEKENQAKLEEEKNKLERELEAQQRRDAMQQQAQFESDRRYGDSITSRSIQQQAYEQQRADREQRSEQQRAESDRRRQDQDAMRQAEADKRKLRNLEIENHTNRPAVIVVPRK